MERDLSGRTVALLGPMYAVDAVEVRRALTARGAEVVQGASMRADVVARGPHTRLDGVSEEARVIGAEQLVRLVGGAALEEVCTLEGACLVVTGTFEEGSQRELAEQLRGRGARVVANVSSRVDAVVVGARAQAKAAQARARGVPVLGRAHLRAMLNGARLSDLLIEDHGALRAVEGDVLADRTTIEVNAAIGAVRGWAHGTPSEAAWEAICGVIERCSAQAQATVVEYAEQATVCWPDALVMRTPETPDGYEAYVDYAATPAHEQRRMPTRWVREAMAGHDHPKMAACRVLVHGYKGLGNGQAVRLVESEGLAGLRGLYVPSNRLSEGFCARLERGGVLPNLELLDVAANPLSPDGLKRLLRAPMWSRLRAANLSSVELGACDPSALEGLKAPHLRALALASNGLSSDALLALANAKLPALEWLDLSDNGLDVWDAGIIALSVWSKLRVLKLKPCEAGEGELRGLVEFNLKGLEHLEVGAARGVRASIQREDGPLLRERLERLHTLDVSLRGLARGGVGTLWEAGVLPELRVLRLAQSELPGAELGALLRVCPRVRTLDLSDCGLSAEAVRALAEVPRDHPLERLVLANNRLTSDAIARLLRLPIAANLVELDVSSNRVEALGPIVEALAERGDALRLEVLRLWSRELLCAPASARRLLDASGLDRLQRVEVDLHPTMCSDPLRRAFRARFGT